MAVSGYDPSAPSAGGGAFPGSGPTGSTSGSVYAQDSTLGITNNQGNQLVPQTLSAGSMGPPNMMTVRELLNEFNTMPSTTMTAWEQTLFNAGFMSDAVYRSGNVSVSDIFNAYKKAILGSATTGTELNQYLNLHVDQFNAQGGPKVKLPAIKETAALTSPEDVRAAGNSVWVSLLGRRMSDAEANAVTQILNTKELAGKTQEANAAYSAQVAAMGGGTGTMDASGNVTGSEASGPQIVQYTQAPSATAAAEDYAMTNDKPEVTGRTVAAAMNSISQFIGQK